MIGLYPSMIALIIPIKRIISREWRRGFHTNTVLSLVTALTLLIALPMTATATGINSPGITVIEKPSKNFDDTAIQPKWIVIHCIGYDENKALGILLGDYPDIVASAHYFIPQRNELSHDLNLKTGYPVYHLVDDNLKAYHAGVSQWREDVNLNTDSIGIEFNSPNYGYAVEKPDQINWYHFEAFPDAQIEAGIILIKALIAKHHINPENILTHSDIAAWREVNHTPVVGKTDPGSYFPMELLAKNGIGVWPRFQRTRVTNLDTSVKNAQFLLKAYGYHLEVTGVLDVSTIATIKAFKMHFMPEEYHDNEVSDVINEKMITGLENLLDKEYKYKPYQPFVGERT